MAVASPADGVEAQGKVRAGRLTLSKDVSRLSSSASCYKPRKCSGVSALEYSFTCFLYCRGFAFLIYTFPIQSTLFFTIFFSHEVTCDVTSDSDFLLQFDGLCSAVI